MGFDPPDCCERFGFGTGGDVDFGAFEIEDVCYLFSDPGRGTGHDEDFAGLVGDVFFGELGRGWEGLG